MIQFSYSSSPIAEILLRVSQETTLDYTANSCYPPTVVPSLMLIKFHIHLYIFHILPEPEYPIPASLLGNIFHSNSTETIQEYHIKSLNFPLHGNNFFFCILTHISQFPSNLREENVCLLFNFDAHSFHPFSPFL